MMADESNEDMREIPVIAVDREKGQLILEVLQHCQGVDTTLKYEDAEGEYKTLCYFSGPQMSNLDSLKEGITLLERVSEYFSDWRDKCKQHLIVAEAVEERMKEAKNN